MRLNFKHAIIGAALASIAIVILACGGDAPAEQPAPTAPTAPVATTAPASTATTVPVVARVDTPAPPSPTTEPAPTMQAPTPEPVEEPAETATSAPIATLTTTQPTQAPVDTPTAEPPPPTATPEPTAQPTATPVPPTATAIPTSTPEPTAAPSPQVGANVSNLAPGFSLQSARSGEYALESFRGDKNVVLVFYRAFWWPFCRQQLVELTEYYAAIQKEDAIILAVSADDLKGAEGAAHQWGAPFPILSDSDRATINAYDVLTSDNIARPSTFIIDKDGIIRWKYVGSTGDRPSPQVVLEELKAIEG